MTVEGEGTGAMELIRADSTMTNQYDECVLPFDAQILLTPSGETSEVR